MPNKTVITMSAQYGGANTGNIVQPIGNELKSRLRELDGSYSDAIEKIKINLFVSGDVTKFDDPSGWSNIKIMQKSGYVSFDLTFQSDVVESGEKKIWKYFQEFILDALKAIDKKMKDKKFDFKLDKIVSDLSSHIFGS